MRRELVAAIDVNHNPLVVGEKRARRETISRRVTRHRGARPYRSRPYVSLMSDSLNRNRSLAKFPPRVALPGTDSRLERVEFGGTCRAGHRGKVSMAPFSARRIGKRIGTDESRDLAACNVRVGTRLPGSLPRVRVRLR